MMQINKVTLAMMALDSRCLTGVALDFIEMLKHEKVIHTVISKIAYIIHYNI